MVEPIYIAGLRELRNALKAVEPGLQREMQRENKAFTARIVPRAQAAYNAVYPKPTSKQKQTLCAWIQHLVSTLQLVRPGQRC